MAYFFIRCIGAIEFIYIDTFAFDGIIGADDKIVFIPDRKKYYPYE